MDHPTSKRDDARRQLPSHNSDQHQSNNGHQPPTGKHTTTDAERGNKTSHNSESGTTKTEVHNPTFNDDARNHHQLQQPTLDHKEPESEQHTSINTLATENIPTPRPRPRPSYTYKIHYHASCSKTGAWYHIIRTGPSYLLAFEKSRTEVRDFHASWFEHWWDVSRERAEFGEFKRRSRRWWARNAKRYNFADRGQKLEWREWERICMGKHGGMGEEWLREEARRKKYWERGVGEEWGFWDMDRYRDEDEGVKVPMRRRVWRVRRVGCGNSRVRVVRMVR